MWDNTVGEAEGKQGLSYHSGERRNLIYSLRRPNLSKLKALTGFATSRNILYGYTNTELFVVGKGLQSKHWLNKWWNINTVKLGEKKLLYTRI